MHSPSGRSKARSEVENAAFVLVAIAVSALGSVLLWYRHRRPRTFMSSIEEFQREMHALARDDETEPRYRRRSNFRQRSVEREAPTDVQERSERR
jgi:hypothetical protein